MKSEFCLGVFRIFFFLASGLFSAIASPSVNRPTTEISGAFPEKPGFWNFPVWLCGSIRQLFLLLGVAWCVYTSGGWKVRVPLRGLSQLGTLSALGSPRCCAQSRWTRKRSTSGHTVQLQEAEFPSRGSALLWKWFIIKLEGFLKQ